MTIFRTASRVGIAALILLAAIPVTQAQINVEQGAGARFSYVYNPLTEGEPPDVVAEPEGHFPLSYANEGNAAFLFSRTEGPSSATWHFQLTDPNAIWSNDIWVKGGVLLIGDAAIDKASNYWVYEYSTDGVEFFPFLSTRTSDEGQSYYWPVSGAHSGSGAISLSRGGYEGGGQDLYIRLTAVNTTSEGVWMQALRVDGEANREFQVNGSILSSSEANAMVSVTLQTAAPLNQSAGDALNGLVGVLSQDLFQGGAAEFSDASSETSPDNNVLWQPDNAAHHVTWDLGEEGAADRQLDRFSVWLSADDPGRKNYHGGISVSMDGTTFVDVPGSHYANLLPHASGAYNNVDHQFAPGQTIGFRYLRFTSYGLAADGDVYWQPRVVEVDAFVSSATSGEGGFAGWRSDHFTEAELADENISGPAADPDGDRIPNLMEYALGRDPKVASADNLPVSGVVTHSGEDYLALSFRRPSAISDIDYIVEVSGDLISWSPDAVALDETPHEDGTTTFSFRDSVPLTEGERRFMRLRVREIE